MPHVNLQRDQVAYETFEKLFEGFAGNILDWQDRMADSRTELRTKLQTPRLCFEGVRYKQGEDSLYHLISFKPLETYDL